MRVYWFGLFTRTGSVVIICACAVHGAMISGGWVCALHVRTAGLGGAALGSDEEEIVYLAYVVIDVHTNQVSLKIYTKTPLN